MRRLQMGVVLVAVSGSEPVRPALLEVILATTEEVSVSCFPEGGSEDPLKSTISFPARGTGHFLVIIHAVSGLSYIIPKPRSLRHEALAGVTSYPPLVGRLVAVLAVISVMFGCPPRLIGTGAIQNRPYGLMVLPLHNPVPSSLVPQESNVRVLIGSIAQVPPVVRRTARNVKNAMARVTRTPTICRTFQVDGTRNLQA